MRTEIGKIKLIVAVVVVVKGEYRVNIENCCQLNIGIIVEMFKM